MCERCQTPSPKKLCHSCAVTLANRKKKSGVKSVVGHLDNDYNQYMIQVREWSKAIKGTKKKVPIAEVKWLERPMP